jgi:hypothetical protein
MKNKWASILGIVGLIVGLLHPQNLSVGVDAISGLAFALPWAIIFWVIGFVVDKLIQKFIPNADTHVKCPDCRELVLKDARKCKHCGCSLIPQ